MQNRLNISNLSEEVGATTLQELFEPYGFVMDVKMVKRDGAGQALGSALVTMATDEAAAAAIGALNGATLHGSVIRVEAAGVQTPAARTPPGGES